MSKENRDKLVEKLKKLFALGKSSNQHEAELALQKASELMKEYQIGVEEIDWADIGEIDREVYTVPETNGNRQWIYNLARSCAKLYDGDVSFHSTRGQMKLCFFGTPTDILAAKMTFEHLWMSWLSIVKNDWEKIRDAFNTNHPNDILKGSNSRSLRMEFKQGHGVGFSNAIYKRVIELINNRVKEVITTSTGRDLILLKSQSLKDFMERHTEKRPAGDGSEGMQAGRELGHRAGSAIPLQAAVGPDKPKLLS